MKNKIFIIGIILRLMLIFSFSTKAQNTYSAEFTAILSNGSILKDTVCNNIEVAIIKDSFTGTLVYSEKHDGVTINANGSYTLVIGTGLNKTGLLPSSELLLSTIYYIKTSFNGNVSYTRLKQSITQ